MIHFIKKGHMVLRDTLSDAAEDHEISLIVEALEKEYFVDQEVSTGYKPVELPTIIDQYNLGLRPIQWYALNNKRRKEEKNA